MSRIRRIAPGLGRGGLIGNTEGPEAYLRELDTLPSQFCRATGGTETVISQGGKYYRVHTFTDTDPTSLLLNFDGANGSTTFTDDSGWGHAVTANGDAEISTTESRFGGSSAYFDGNGDGLTGATTVPLRLGGGDFTAEWWMYFSSLSGYQTILSFGYTPADAGGWAVQTGNGNGKVAFSKINGPASTSIIASDTGSTVNAGQWYHIAIARSSGTLTIYRDGVSVGSGADSTDYTRGVNFYIGGGSSIGFDNFYFNGYIDSLRIVKGAALYTSAFTPPTQALTRVGSGSLTFTRGGAVEYLVVGGGGGGGSVQGGGGGAGGFRTGNLSVAPRAQSVGVGAGGAGVSSALANNGQASSFADISAAGGGRGGGILGTNNAAGGSGGSGGGAAPGNTVAGTGNTPSTSPAQGNNGGAGATVGNAGGGGGGGAGAAGQTAPGTTAGNGGSGASSSISGTSVTYAGGGGGGTSSFGGGSAGSGGAGGGGDGKANDTTAESGTANTGGGGGAAGYAGGSGTSGSGGSGIIIARYRITQAEYEAEAA